MVAEFSVFFMSSPLVAANAWQLDSTAQNCNACRAEFSFFRRRHHCRACGLIFCDDCTRSRRTFLNSVYGLSAQRVCQPCLFKSQVPLAPTATLATPQVHDTYPAGKSNEAALAAGATPVANIEAATLPVKPSAPSEGASSNAALGPIAVPADEVTCQSNNGCLNIYLSPETPTADRIICSNGWYLYHQNNDEKQSSRKTVWVLSSPGPTFGLSREQIQELDSQSSSERNEELLRVVPFVDILTVRGVELQLELSISRGTYMICGKVRLLTGSCWNPSSIRNVWFNGDWYVSAAAEVPVVGSFGDIGYIQWSSALNPGARNATKTFLRGNGNWPHASFGPLFHFETCSNDNECTAIRRGNLMGVQEPLYVELNAGERRDKISLSNGYILKREKTTSSVAKWHLHPNTGQAFVDTLILRNVLLYCGSGRVWWEGHVIVATGAGLYFGGGNCMFNGSWSLGHDACVPARMNSNIVGLQKVSPHYIEEVEKSHEYSCKRRALFVKYATGRRGAGSNSFGPAFDFKLL